MISQNDDDEKREKAYQDLATVWQERLQLISAIVSNMTIAIISIAMQTHNLPVHVLRLH